LHDGLFVTDTDYEPELARRLRAVPNSWYDKGKKVWMVPPVPESAYALQTVVDEYDLASVGKTIEELERIAELHAQIHKDARLSSVQRYLYRAPDFESLIVLPKNHTIGEEFKLVVGAVWDKRIRAYRVEADARSADDVLRLAAEYDFFVEPAEYERLASMGNTLFEDEDFSYYPLASIDRMMYRMLIQLPPGQRENLFDAVRNHRYL
jgi:hypothetical protein